MTKVRYVDPESLGFKAKRLRVSQMLTQQELANVTGVSREEVDLFEQNLPVRLDAKRKLIKELWVRKVRSTVRTCLITEI